MKRHVFILLLSFAGVLTSAFAASRQVQGVVISSEDNMPLIGASVYIKAEDRYRWKIQYFSTGGGDTFILQLCRT